MSAESFIEELAALLRKYKARYSTYITVEVVTDELEMTAEAIFRELPDDVK
jgi:hypothetical protein